MQNDTSTIRLRAGATAVLIFLLSVFAAGLVLTSGIDIQAIERGSADIILPILAANPTVMAVVAWEVVIVSILVAIFSIDLYRILVDGQSGLLFAPIAFIGGAVLFITEVLLLLGISQGIAPKYAGTTGAEQSAIEGTAQALLLFRSRMLLVGGVLWSLGTISFGRGFLRSSEFPSWVGYWGYATGVAGVIGGFFPLFTPLLSVRALGQFLFILWILFAGSTLLRRR